MMTVSVNIKNVVIPGVPLPVSGEVCYLPASHHVGSGSTLDPEVIDAQLVQQDGTPVNTLPLPLSYHALLRATQEEYESSVRDQWSSIQNGIDPEIPF